MTIAVTAAKQSESEDSHCIWQKIFHSSNTELAHAVLQCSHQVFTMLSAGCKPPTFPY